MENLYKILADIKAQNRPAYLAVITKTKGTTSSRVGAKMVVFPDGRFEGTIGGGEVELEIRKLIKEGKVNKAKTFAFNLTGKSASLIGADEQIDIDAICGGFVEVYVEPLHNPEVLYIVGGGHCGVELSELAAKCGFYVVVIDNRKEWASKEKHPYANKLIICEYSEIENYMDFSVKPYVVVMTPKHTYDKQVMELLIDRELKYLGFMGSEYKVKQTFEQLRKSGFNEEKLKKIFSPIGFPIGSKTPAEIAVSITAQLIAVRNGLSEVSFSSNPLLKGK